MNRKTLDKLYSQREAHVAAIKILESEKDFAGCAACNQSEAREINQTKHRMHTAQLKFIDGLIDDFIGA